VWHLIYIETQQKHLSPLRGGSILRAFSWPRHKIEGVTNDFYGICQADGHKSTGCFDLKCSGFVPVNYAPITPGDTLDVKSNITVKIFKVGCKLSCNVYDFFLLFNNTIYCFYVLMGVGSFISLFNYNDRTN
jgi:hypothetical protein